LYQYKIFQINNFVLIYTRVYYLNIFFSGRYIKKIGIYIKHVHNYLIMQGLNAKTIRNEVLEYFEGLTRDTKGSVTISYDSNDQKLTVNQNQKLTLGMKGSKREMVFMSMQEHDIKEIERLTKLKHDSSFVMGFDHGSISNEFSIELITTFQGVQN